MKKCTALLVLIFFIFITDKKLFPESSLNHQQSTIISNILNKENEKNRRDEIISIINYIDRTYTSIFENLQKGEKITIFFDPAHGKDDTGRWRGITTNRIGVTGQPEEWYSIIYSRKLYNLLKGNKFFRITTSDDYQDVLDGKSESYHYMKFNKVVSMAKDEGAFIVIAMHMNNVSIFSKADGMINMPGIHMARDHSGRKMLINIYGTFSGFLTLYNKYDASGFSKLYALNIKDSLVKKGYAPNGWEYGAVGDDRFTYYLNFPVSVIYECGFISHPAEESKLRDDKYSSEMVKTHYDMLLKSFNDMFGIDISGDKFTGDKKDFIKRVELLKLARIAIYYMQNADTDGLNRTIKSMSSSTFNNLNSDIVQYYKSKLRVINASENSYARGLKHKKRKKYAKARECFSNAISMLSRNEMFSAYKDKYKIAIYGNRKTRKDSDGTKIASTLNTSSKKSHESSIEVKRSQITKPFILSISPNETLEHAVIESLAPDSSSLKRIMDSMNGCKNQVYAKSKKSSGKKKKPANVVKTQKINFNQGIFIVTLNKNMQVVKTRRVSSVYLNPQIYQNEQYLKNSFFTESERKKDL